MKKPPSKRPPLLDPLARGPLGGHPFWVAVRIAVLTGALALTLGGAAMFVYLGNLGVFAVSPSHLEAIENIPLKDNTIVFARDGSKIGEFFTQYHVYVPFQELPPRLVEAIIAVEDRNFWTHKGFDPRGILRAFFVTVRAGNYSQGASTLTQQLVRNHLLLQEKTIERKIQEIALAYHLEKRLNKKRIFEYYANTLFLGNGAYGVGAASERYFGKPLSQLNLAELALIAGLFQSPSGYNPQKYPKKAIARQRVVLQAMVDAGYLSSEMAMQASLFPITFHPYSPINTQTAPYYVDHIREQAKQVLESTRKVAGKGLRIHTSLDPRLQKLGEKVFTQAPTLWQTAVAEKKKRETTIDDRSLEAALVAIDPATGEILAMLGGRSYESSQFNRVTSATRSPGSTFKPIVYSAALAQGMSWNQVQYVAPVTVKNYRPRNHSGDFGTETTLLRAFYRSFNTTAVEIAGELGLGRLLAHARLMGVESPLKPEMGTALGGSEVTLMDMARAYGTMANGGLRVESTSILRIEDRAGNLIYEAPRPEARATRALTPQVAYLMTEGLRTVLTHGTANAAKDLAQIAVGKTGTSNQAKDNWFCGYTPNLVVVVWVGTDTNAALPTEAMGSTLALPLWKEFIKEASVVRPPGNFSRPEGIAEAPIHPMYGNRLTRGGLKTFFLSGREPASDAPHPLQQIQEKRTFRRVFE